MTRTHECTHLGKKHGHGLGRQPDVYRCANEHTPHGLCTIANPTNHVFPKPLNSCDTCPLYHASEKPLAAAPCAAKKLPPLLIQGWNFAKAMYRAATNGFPKCSPEKISERLAICEACPELTTDRHCALCGCACSQENVLTNKLALETEKCPIGKW